MELGQVWMDIIGYIIGAGVWAMNRSELGALFLNLCLVCVSGDNVTIFPDCPRSTCQWPIFAKLFSHSAFLVTFGD